MVRSTYAGFGKSSLLAKLKYDTKTYNIIPTIILELTARCNNNCRHCYINLPANDIIAKGSELTFDQLRIIIDEAVTLGTYWCVLTGGEPLIREDFSDIYLYIKKKGLFITLLCNGTLLSPRNVELLKKYPPNRLEISIYGMTKNTNDRVTRNPNSFTALKRNFNLLKENNVDFVLKTIAMRSNLDEFDKIIEFASNATKKYCRFDPFLHLRLDKDPGRNMDIVNERLSPEEICEIERQDSERYKEGSKLYKELKSKKRNASSGNKVFLCSAGSSDCVVGHNGFLRPCISLWHPDYLYDLRNGTLYDGWRSLSRKCRELQSSRRMFLENCGSCQIVEFCMWCPAHSYLESGELDMPNHYYCEVARARVRVFGSD